MNLQGFDKNSPWLILAPHLTYPTWNGADVSIDRMACSISRLVPYVDLIAADRIYRFKFGKIEEEIYFKNKHRSKSFAAFRAIILNDHYFGQRFNTPAFLLHSKNYLAKQDYRTIVFSYLTTSSLIANSKKYNPDRLHMVWTHNDEFRWFADMQRKTKNPLISLTAHFAQKWLYRFLENNEKDLLLLHVTDEDWQGFLRIRPNHRAMRVSIGVDVQYHLPLPDHSMRRSKDEPIRLMFLGSLYMKMNEDAIMNFAEVYFPALKNKLPFSIEVRIVGSNPTKQISDLCQRLGWKLHKNVSDDELKNLFISSDFSLMPFKYTNGAKLKLLHSLAHGLPFLGTKTVSGELMNFPDTCLTADSPDEWVEHIKSIRDREDRFEHDRELLLQYANKYSWDTASTKLFKELVSYSSLPLAQINS